MNLKLTAITILASTATGASIAGLAAVPLGTTLGDALGSALKTILGHPAGADLLSSSGALLGVAAASLLLGIYVVRRKQRR